MTYFSGGKIDYRGGNTFPLASSQLYIKHS